MILAEALDKVQRSSETAGASRELALAAAYMRRKCVAASPGAKAFVSMLLAELALGRHHQPKDPNR